MKLIGYKQSTSLELISACLSGPLPEDAVFELSIYSKKSASTDDYMHVYIDDELVYDLDFKNKKYTKKGAEFYLTDIEAFALYMYLNNIFEPLVPHWWPYAARNIARHNNPLKELNEAKKQGKKIVLTFD